MPMVNLAQMRGITPATLYTAGLLTWLIPLGKQRAAGLCLTKHGQRLLRAFSLCSLLRQAVGTGQAAQGEEQEGLAVELLAPQIGDRSAVRVTMGAPQNAISNG